jgi:B9 domain-containing protein 1
VEEGVSQMSKAAAPSSWSRTGPSVSAAPSTRINVWNLPLDIGFKSTNFYGWPELLITVYGQDVFGRDVIRGYGTCKLPINTGEYVSCICVQFPS